MGDRGGTVVKVLCYKSEGRWLMEFFIDIKSFRSHYGPGVDSASKRNEYQEPFLGSKGGRCVWLTILPQSCAVVMKSGNLNFLEPSGPLQACNGTALPFIYINNILYIVSIPTRFKASASSSGSLNLALYYSYKIIKITAQ